MAFVYSLTIALFICSMVFAAYGKPTIYMKNENDKLEPLLLPISSTVIPIPVYQVTSHVNVKVSKSLKKKLRFLKPDGPTQLITGLKKMLAHEKIKEH